MTYFQFNNVQFAALASAVPAHVQVINTSSENPRAKYIKSFTRQTGIKQRHISITEQTCTDLGYIAAQKALKKTGWDIESLDALVFMSQTPDYNSATSNAHITHYRLGMRKDSIVFDVPQGCTSFPYGLFLSASLLQQSQINRILLICGDTIWSSYGSKEELLAAESPLFGDATSAILLEKGNASDLKITLYADGAGYKYLFNPFSGSRNAWRRHYGKFTLPDGAEFSGFGSYMDGMEITSFSTTTVVNSIHQFLGDTHTTMDSYDGLVLHQANFQIIKTIARRLNVAMEKVPVTVDRFANTSASSIPLTMADAYAGDSREKLHLLTSGFGIGLSWGIASLDIQPDIILPVIFCEGGQFEEGFVKEVG